MAKSKMSCTEIKKAVYLSATEELYIQFVDNVIPGYDTVVFENVDHKIIKDFKAADNRERYFNDYIRTSYKYYASHIAFAEIQSPSVYNRARDIKTYEQYCAEQKELMHQKDLAAMNAL